MPSTHQQRLPHDIIRIDTGLMQPETTACYLLGSNGHWAFVESGTVRSVPRLLEALRLEGIAREQVDYVIPTHVHLDHAGGAGALLGELPRARLVIHPRGARHMIDPSRLTAGATAVYGEPWLREHYGELMPAAPERVLEAADGFELELAGRRLAFLHTEGHARHHFCVWDERSRGLFTGDTFGISLRDFDTEQGPFLYLASAPVQFDPEAWHLSLDRLIALEPECVYLTHFGRVEGVPALAGVLREQIDRGVELVRLAAKSDDPGAVLRESLTADMLQRLEVHGCTRSRDAIMKRIGMDIELNSQGLEVWFDKSGP